MEGMKIHGVKRLESLHPTLARRILRSPLPGEYLMEYFSYTFSEGSLVSNSVYLHEPEWLGAADSLAQRKAVLGFLRDVIGEHSDIFSPSGNPVRLDPSFRSCDADTTLRLEMLYNNPDAECQLRYVRSVIAYVCGKDRVPVVETKLPTVPAYHCAVEFDMLKRLPCALRLYFRLPKASGKEFDGLTILSSGEIISRKVYWRPSVEEIRAFPVILPFGFSPAYAATESGGLSCRQRIYLFNDLWNDVKGGSNGHS